MKSAPFLLRLSILPVLALSVRAEEFDTAIRPLLDEFCLKCHSTAEQKGDFDLEQYSSLAAMKKHPKPWQMVLQQMIDGESPDDVLSDDKLVEKLKADGIDIARRTVAKYREAMHIQPANLRKSI